MKIIAFIRQRRARQKDPQTPEFMGLPQKGAAEESVGAGSAGTFSQEDEKHTLHYSTEDECDTHRACALMAADSWEGYYDDQDTPIEHFCIDPEPEYDYV